MSREESKESKATPDAVPAAPGSAAVQIQGPPSKAGRSNSADRQRKPVAAASELLRAAARWHQEWIGLAHPGRASAATPQRTTAAAGDTVRGTVIRAAKSLGYAHARRAARNRRPWRGRFLTRPSRCHTGPRQQTCPQPRLRRQQHRSRLLMNPWRGPTTLSRSKADSPR